MPPQGGACAAPGRTSPTVQVPRQRHHRRDEQQRRRQCGEHLLRRAPQEYRIASRRLWSFLPSGNAVATTSTGKRAKKSPCRSKAPTTTTSGIFRSPVGGHAAAIELRRCTAPRRGRARRRDVMSLRASSDAHAPRLPISPERRPGEGMRATEPGEDQRWRVGKVVSSPPSESRLGGKAPSTTMLRPPRPTTTSGMFPLSSGGHAGATELGRGAVRAAPLRGRACGFPWSTARPRTITPRRSDVLVDMSH
jgi:hypothetical protein